MKDRYYLQQKHLPKTLQYGYHKNEQAGNKYKVNLINHLKNKGQKSKQSFVLNLKQIINKTLSTQKYYSSTNKQFKAAKNKVNNKVNIQTLQLIGRNKRISSNFYIPFYQRHSDILYDRSQTKQLQGSQRIYNSKQDHFEKIKSLRLQALEISEKEKIFKEYTKVIKPQRKKRIRQVSKLQKMNLENHRTNRKQLESKIFAQKSISPWEN